MNPIATYADNHWLWKQKIELFPDRLTIDGSRLFSSSWQITHPLHALNPSPSLGWTRPAGFSLGLFVGSLNLGLAVYWVLLGGMDLRDYAPKVLGFVGCLALIWAVISVRRRRFATFVSDAGVSVIGFYDSSRSHAFEEFVGAVTKQIQEVKRAA